MRVPIPYPDADLSWSSLRGRWPHLIRRTVTWAALVEHSEHLESLRVAP